ncbi:NADH dehydrogenase [ubiquinone] 1 beta subcomplex subunit 9-like protein [Leptotrombidium deliense]|uniref:NADH dehydrogenase [ubiquinone] 1 beta subcomplex subunit 9-like protein n=1 Tax=Leptotrombidium deliense TaxID=299467 RepID=A0A443SHV1_9ACAR|nr:NADH dehydrogenase [ubiquinone] 1 beta subcomplex subunit 9-like protein [Leptotrombidium deliense]
MKFTWSPGGICFERYYELDDWALDFWHPYEKAQYPYYFARREKRKEEYIKLYESEYGDAQKVLGVDKHVDYTAYFGENPETPKLADGSDAPKKIEDVKK